MFDGNFIYPPWKINIFTLKVNDAITKERVLDCIRKYGKKALKNPRVLRDISLWLLLSLLHTIFFFKSIHLSNCLISFFIDLYEAV